MCILYFVVYLNMICKASITLNDKVKKAGQDKARDNALRGGFSEYVEKLIKADLKKDGLTFNDK